MGSHNQDKISEMDFSNPLFVDFQEKFLQIKALAENGQNVNKNAELIEKISRQGLGILSYVLFAVHANQTELPLTSLSAAAAAQDVASELSQLAKAYNITIKLDAGKKLEPVYANYSAIKGSLYGLLSGLILSNQSSGKSTITVAVQQTATTTQRIGVYSNDLSINLADIANAGHLSHKAKMIAPDTSSSSGIGFALASQLVDRLDSNLKSFSHKRTKGVGFYVPMSRQLTFI